MDPDSVLGRIVRLEHHCGTLMNRHAEKPIKKERSNPQKIEDKQALFVVNLTPRKMAGLVSEGMLLDLGYADGLTPVLAIPESPIPNGTRAQ